MSVDKNFQQLIPDKIMIHHIISNNENIGGVNVITEGGLHIQPNS